MKKSMPSPRLNALATAAPGHDIHQAFIDWATPRLTDERVRAIFTRMTARSGIDHRWSVLPPTPSGGSPVAAGGFYDMPGLPPTSVRMAAYADHAPDLAMQAIAGLDDALDPARITHLVVASCTGFLAPGITAHEANQNALDRRAEPQSPREDLVDAGGNEAGAARDDQMCDARRIERIAEARDRLHREVGRMFGIGGHTDRCGRQAGNVVETACRDRRPARSGGRQHRPTMVDPRPRRHPDKDRAHTLVAQPRRRPFDKGLMDVMPRNRGGEGVQPGARQGCDHRAHVAEKRETGQRLAPPSLYRRLTMSRLS